MVLPRLTKKSLRGTRKIVHVIRHGQAEHNVHKKFLQRRDTRLTAHGEMQARALRLLMRNLNAKVVVTSPILRALQTTQALSFQGPIVVVPEAREVAGWTANRPIDPRMATEGVLFNEYGAYDWSSVTKSRKQAGSASKYQRGLWDQDVPPRKRWSTTARVRQRARKLTKYLQTRPEDDIVLVSHGEFLMSLTGDSYMGNCEVRTYSVRGDRWRRLRSHRLAGDLRTY